MGSPSDAEIVAKVREKSRQLESLLDDYSSRLRRMRQRNRELEQEIGDFEQQLEQLESWFRNVLDD